MTVIVYVIIAVIVILGSIFIGARILEKKRREGLETVAEELGLEFKPDGDALLQNRLEPHALFNTGRARKLTNLVEGITDEVHIAIFDYAFTTGSGKHQHTSRQTVVSLESSSLVLPNFSMRPENFFDKIGSVLGLQDIDFDSHPDFSMMFVLKGEDEQAIRDFFTPKILEFFETKKGYSVEGHSSGKLIFYRPKSRQKPGQLIGLLEQAYEIFGIVADRAKQD